MQFEEAKGGMKKSLLVNQPAGVDMVAQTAEEHLHLSLAKF